MRIRLLYIFPFLISIGCAISYFSIDSYVGYDGTLVEPFGFVSVGLIFLVIGIITAIFVEFAIKCQKKKDQL